jgi:predicted acyl esterase
LSIPTRDNKYLAADLYSIDSTVAQPAVLIQTPYNKFWYRYSIGLPELQVPYDSLNYNYVVVDWRGFYGSASAESLGYDRGLDGYDIIEWISTRTWSDGKVGTWGPSALGVIQFQTAKHKPPHLKASIPIVSDYKTAYEDFYYGGDYRKELTKMKDSLGFLPESLILAHYTYDLYWLAAEILTDYPDSINVPMLLITGWYDHNLDAPLEAFYGLRTRSDTLVRDKHKFLVGPWTHMSVGRLAQGELTYPNAADTPRVVSLRMLDRYLRDINNGYENEPIVRYYQMGENMWRDTDDWYSLSGQTDTLYLNSGGLLSTSPPSISDPDSFLYDPRDPSPSIGGVRFDPFNSSLIIGPRDQRDSVESRDDALVYTTGVLGETVIVVGNISVEIYIESNRFDTDFSARITDVYPDGRSMLITEGLRRARFRNTFLYEELLVPEDTYFVEIEMQNIAYSFLPGHRVRAIVSSSDYPIFEINLNNGDSLYVPGDTLVATNRVFHDANNPSRLVLRTASSSCIFEDDYKEYNSYNLEAVRTPFSSRTTFRFSIPLRALTSLKIYNTCGQEVRTLQSGYLPAGDHRFIFDATGLPGGLYFCRLVVDGRERGTSKVILLK